MTKDFTLAELIRSTIADENSIDNTPTSVQTMALRHLAKTVLQPARDAINEAIFVLSGFRTTAVNNKAGGASGSQHVKGEAADLICSDNAKLFNHIKNNLTFDQLIWEFGDNKQPNWVHVSKKLHNNRMEILMAKKENGRTVYSYYDNKLKV